MVGDWLEEDDGDEIDNWINDQHSTAEDVEVINKLIDEDGGNIKTLKYVRGRRASVAPPTAMLPGGVEIPAALLALGGGGGSAGGGGGGGGSEAGGGRKLDKNPRHSNDSNVITRHSSPTLSRHHNHRDTTSNKRQGSGNKEGRKRTRDQGTH